MPKKSILIFIGILMIVWFPYFFNYYDVISAIVITIGVIISGIIGERMLQRKKQKK
ncbi:MAG: hypothetical protein Q7J34_03320 [Bacteroidales bacterium]|nr:hypothetical protein [Bacteroidales bacterium]